MIGAEYLAWLGGDSSFRSVVALQDFSDTGRGLCARERIEMEDTILEIPAEKILSALNFRFSPLFHLIPSDFFPSWVFSGTIEGIYSICARMYSADG